MYTWLCTTAINLVLMGKNTFYGNFGQIYSFDMNFWNIIIYLTTKENKGDRLKIREHP